MTLFTCHHSPVSACPEGNNIFAVLLGGLGTQTQIRRLFGWPNLDLSQLIFSHIILFILLAEDYSFSKPNSLKGNTWPMHIQACSVWPILTYWERNKTLLLCKRQVRGFNAGNDSVKPTVSSVCTTAQYLWLAKFKPNWNCFRCLNNIASWKWRGTEKSQANISDEHLRQRK